MNSHINNNTTSRNFLQILEILPSYTNGNFTYLQNNYAYLIFNSNGSVLFKEDTPCEILIVGAGGRGGSLSTFGGSGGGGCGEIKYYPSFLLSSNNYDINIGIDSADSNLRISKIINKNKEIIINSIGGGDGAYWDGSSYGSIQRFPPQSFTSNTPILLTTYNNKTCYKSTIIVNSNSYDIYYSSKFSSYDAINLFNCLEPSNVIETVFQKSQYNTLSPFTYIKSNFLFESTYKGDWVFIKLPIPISLTSYSFFQNTTELGGSPNNYRIYGSIDGINWTIITSRSSSVPLSYSSYKFTDNNLSTNIPPYLYFGLVVNSILNNIGYLNFNEWVLYGKPIIITPPTLNGGNSIFNLPSNQIQGGFGGSYSNLNLIKTIQEDNTSIFIPYDNHFFKINKNPINTYLNSGIYSAIFNEGIITFNNQTYYSYPVLTTDPVHWFKFNSNSGFNDNLIISGNITKNINDIYFEYGSYLTPTITQLSNNNGISISFWIKPEISIGDYLWIFKTTDNPNEYISFHQNQFKISNNGVITSVNFSNNILDGLYHHFVCSINPSGKIYVACDGIYYENSSLNPFIIKSYINGTIGKFFQGYMKDFRIYLKTLDLNDIKELFKGRIEIFYNRYSELITTTNIQIGSGGIGGTSNSIPTIKNFYGDGGDANNGLGFNGIIIIKYPYPYFNTIITPYKFPNSQFLKFSSSNNPSGISFKLLQNYNDNRLFSIDNLNFLISSNAPYIYSTSNININGLYINSNNIGFGTNNGINNSLSINNFTIQKYNSNISFINSSGFIGIGTTNPINFFDIRNNVSMSKLNIGSFYNSNSNLNIFGNSIITGYANISNLILNGIIYKNNGIPYIDSGWTTINNNIFNSYSVVGIGTTFPRFQNRLDVFGTIKCNEVNVNGAILTNEFIRKSGTTVETIYLGTLKTSYGGTGNNSFTSNQILNSSILWSNKLLTVFGNLNNCNMNNERLVLNDGIRIGNILINKFGISNNYENSNIIISSNLFIKSNIGIGTTNPLNMLDIRGNMNINKNLILNNISNNEFLNGKILNVSNISIENTGKINRYLSRWGNNNNYMAYVGIGTTNPQNSLDIYGNLKLNGVLNISNISNNLILNGVFLNISNIYIENSVITYKNNNNFIGSRWSLSNSNIIYNSGFVGIRTNIIDSNLTINGNVAIKGFLNMNSSNISNINWFNGKILNISNLRFLTNSSGIINFINGNTFNLNNWTSYDDNTNTLFQTFNYTGTIQTFNVPAGVSSINIYCWGAGGGSGSTYNNQAGGDGGFVKATLNVSYISSLKIIVGQGGRKAVNASSSGSAFGGGGSGYAGGGWELGGGGGLSGIFVDNANMTVTGTNINTNAIPIIISGAGGASGGYSGITTAFPGGNGGSNTGNDCGTGSEGGKGATLSAGGLGGTGTAGADSFGIQGTLFNGANGNSRYGGGGGGGYYGGGGGGFGNSIVGGGGGGSSYLNTTNYQITNITNLKTLTNNSRSPPGTTEKYYQSGIATGAVAGLNNGGDGLIVIEYLTKKSYYNYGYVGIKTISNQSNSIDINGDLNLSGNITNSNNQLFNFENFSGSITTNPVVNIINNSFNNSYGYYQFTSITNTITFNRDILCDVLVVGAGGNGGSGAYSGGGGAGEVIYQPNYLFQKGSYVLTVGTSSTDINNRISKITKGSTDIFKALGGGNGNVNVISITGTGNSIVTGTGNSIYLATDNEYFKYAFFANTGTFKIDKDMVCDILIVGGGGGGGRNDGWEGGGGGGAGGVGIGTINLKKDITYNITIGSGGNASTNGGDTTIIGDLINERAYGGGGGGWGPGNNGGSGSGGTGNGQQRPGGTATKGLSSSSGLNANIIYYGNGGGTGNWDSCGGGGGGAGNAGNSNGNGGNGIPSSITGTSTYYGGGGGGAANRYGGSPGSGGLGGGGTGGNRSNPASGISNTGGGGGGASFIDGGNGGSGVIIIRFLYFTNNIITKSIYNYLLSQRTLLINYYNQIILTNGTYNINFNNGSIYIGDNSLYVAPWGAYFADDWSNTTLLDSSGNGRHATTSGTITKTTGSGNGATGAITYISGGTSATVSWPSGSIPANFTILSLTRYNGGSRGRILNGNTGNWLHGHWSSGRGVAHYEFFVTPGTSIGILDDWVCTIGKNSGSISSNILVDGVGRGNATGGTGGQDLRINLGNINEVSDWALCCVIIYNSILSDDYMIKLNNYINTYKSTGNILDLKSNIFGIVNNSYPIIKDEKQYPPKLYDSSTAQTSITGELTNISPTTFYKETFTINSYSNGYGIGIYTIYTSSMYDSGAGRINLFNYNNSDDAPHWSASSYTAPNGTYPGSSYIVSGYTGDWIIIKLPIQIILTSFSFYYRPSLISRCPSLWKCYGSNDGITFTEITEASNSSIELTFINYSLGYYKQILKSFSTLYSYIGFVFNKLIGGNANAYILNFSEIQLFGRETNSIIDPYIWYKFDDSSTNMLIDTINATNNLINNNTTYDNINFVKGTGSIKFTASSSQYALLPNNFNWNTINTTNGISFSWWARNNSSSGSWARIWDFGIKNTTNATQGSRYIMVSKLSTGTDHRFEITNPAENSTGNSYYFDTSGVNYFDSTWRHYVWTINPTGIWNIYINNIKILDNTQKIVIQTMTQANVINNFGRSLFTNDGYYDGNIDDFRIYNLVLTPNQVNELYNGRVEISQSTSSVIISSGGSGGGSYLNKNNQSVAMTKWNNLYSYVSNGLNGTTLKGGDGGSSLFKSTYNLTGTNQLIAFGGFGATASSIAISKSINGSGGDGNGGSGVSGIIIIKILKNIQNFNLIRNYLFNNNIYNYSILKDIIPTAWYKFEDITNLGKDDFNIYNFTNYNSVSYNSTNFIKGSGSASFDGTYSRYLNGTGVNINNKSFSISFWIYPTNLNNTFIYSSDNSNPTIRTALHIGYRNSTNFTFAFWGDDLDITISNHLNVWNFFTLTYNILNNEKIIYINGILVISGISGGALNCPQNYNIGRGFMGDSYYSGLMDDFRIYSGIVLSKSQIIEIYENSKINFIINGNLISIGCNFIAPINDYPLLTYGNNNIINPFVWYKFDDSTNLGKDEMNNHNLVNTGIVEYYSADYKYGSGSSKFNDLNQQYLIKSNSFNLNSKDFSICFWIKRDSNNKHDEIMIIGNNKSSLNLIDIAIYSTNLIAFNWWAEDFVTDIGYSDAGSWVHLCFTYKTGIKYKSIYRNGVNIKSGTTANEVLTNNEIRIGADINLRAFKGLLDDFRIYDFTLTDTQIQQIYNDTTYTILNNYQNNIYSSSSSNFTNPFIITSNKNIELLSYTNNTSNSLLLQSNINIIINNNNVSTINSNIITIKNSLDIKGNSGTITNQGGAFITTSITTPYDYSNYYKPEYTTFSLRTVDNIICGKNSYALSDNRIKRNINDINDEKSLNMILKIEPKIYKYIDNIGRTNSNVYGFIAQQIRDVLPEATELTSKYIPNIFKLGKINRNIINLSEEDLNKINIGDELQIYTKNNSYEVKIISKYNNGIIIDKYIYEIDIFIYGVKIKDFHIIDKSYLYTLNICATQELVRILEGLKERINNL